MERYRHNPFRGKNRRVVAGFDRRDSKKAIPEAVDKAVQEVVKRYATTIPHELNQPLAIILGYGELISKTDLTPEQMREMTHQISLAAEELAGRVNGFARLKRYRPLAFGGSDMVDIRNAQEES